MSKANFHQPISDITLDETERMRRELPTASEEKARPGPRCISPAVGALSCPLQQPVAATGGKRGDDLSHVEYNRAWSLGALASYSRCPQGAWSLQRAGHVPPWGGSLSCGRQEDI